MKVRALRALLAVLVVLSFFSQGTMVLAGTTGQLSGRITDATGKVVPGATITVTSPSQNAQATTSANGEFGFASLAPDTYTVSVQKQGLQSFSESGVSVFADQTRNLPISLSTLRVIGTTRVTAGSSLVNASQGTDAYTVTPSVQSAAQALGGGGSLNQAYSGLASVPGVFIPQGQSGIYQSVYIRGGDYTQLGYEFDGVPIQRAFDQYPASALSALGQQNLQVYAGSGPLDAQSNGLAGFINQVIKTGTSPGFFNAQFGLGSPTYYHKFELEAGGATPNRLFSYYVGTAGYNQELRYFDQYNGASLDQNFGTQYNYVASGCGSTHAAVGCYANSANASFGTPLGPNGYALGPISFGLNNQIASRETVANLHFGIPHKDGSKDDIQLLYDNSLLQTIFQTGQNDFNYATNDVINGTAFGGTVQNCSAYATPGIGNTCSVFPGDQQFYLDRTVYKGPVGTALTAANVNQVQPYLFPNSPQNRAFDANIDPTERDSYQNRASIEKIQYQKNFGSSAYARVYGYSSYSDWLQNGANSTVIDFAGGVSPDYELLAHTRGVALTLADQVNSQNFAQITAGYTYASTVRWNNAFYNTTPIVGYAVSSADPANGTCYGFNVGTSGADGNAPSAGTAVPCGTTAARYTLPAVGSPVAPLAPVMFKPNPKNAAASLVSPNVTAIGNDTCGGAPCEYLTVNNGVGGTYNTVAPRFSNLSFEDRFRPSDKLLLSVGLHYDDFRYDLADTTVPSGPGTNTVSALQRQFFVNQFITTNCQNPNSLQLVAQPTGGCTAAGLLPVTYNTNSPPSSDYHAFEPRFAATYRLDPTTVLRGSYSKVEQPSSSAFQQYNSAAGALPLVAQFYPIGFRSPAHAIYPEESFNEDFSIEKQIPKSDVSLSATPFFRSTNREIFSVLLDPKTNFVSGVNVGKKLVNGVELEIRKGDFDRDGLAAQLSYTYTHARVHFDQLPNGQTVVDGVNSSVKQYNSYTSFCATNPNDSKCGGVLPTNGLPAAACYAADGTPDPTCAATSTANPYYNAKPQALFDPGAFYPAYNQLPGQGLSSVSSSYVIPHVAALLVQYKKGPFRITPTVQFSGGGKYGSPTQGVGIDPTTCAGTLGAAGVATDPRYPAGLPGGATAANEYDAQTCSGSIIAPDFQTGHFDNFGEFTEPNTLTGNVQLSYDVSKKLTLQATFVNVVNQCFGGQQEPWTHYSTKIGCWYANGPTAYAGNFYNPGDTFQGSANDAYGPVFGNVFQQAYGGQANPFQAYFSLNVKL